MPLPMPEPHPTPSPNPGDALFRALADPTRRALFERLCRDGTATVVELTDGAGVSQPVVSKHLAKLKGAGLVSAHPEGRATRYRAEPAALAPLVDWTEQMAAFWAGRFTALDTLLNRMDQ